MTETSKKTNLQRFGSKMYLVTYETGRGLGCREYGVVKVFNKQKSAQQYLEQLNAQPQKAGRLVEYGLKVIDMDNPSTQLFYYAY
jgi:hypothetical protein